MKEIQLQQREKLTINKITEYPQDFSIMSVEEQMMAKGGVWKELIRRLAKRAAERAPDFVAGVTASITATALWQSLTNRDNDDEYDDDDECECDRPYLEELSRMCIDELTRFIMETEPNAMYKDRYGNKRFYWNRD